MQEGRLAQPLRRGVEQPIGPIGGPFQPLAQFAPLQAVINVGRLTPQPCWQRVHLVLHQRDERRDDQCCTTLGQKRRELVAERLAAAGGQDSQHVLAAHDASDGLQLAGQQCLEAKEPSGGLRDARLLVIGYGHLVESR